MRHFTREEIRRSVPKNIAGLYTDFPDASWAHELIPLLEELLALAAEEVPPDAARLTELEARVTAVIRSDKRLKGLTPILWQIASLKPLSTPNA